jgi:glycoside/pentoside/hexuronide:cation symporter, GPH family
MPLTQTRILIAYALPAMALAMLTGPVFALLPDYFTADIGLPLAATGTALLLSRLWDALCDPVIGIVADRLPSRYGLRKTLMALGLPIMLLGAWIIFVHGHALTPLTLGVSSMILFTGWTCCKLGHDAWGAELSDDAAVRLKITGLREALALLGGLVAIGIIGWGKLPNGPGMRTALTLLFTLITFFALVGFAAAFRFAPDQPRQRSPSDWRKNLSSVMKNQSLRQLAGISLINGLANALPATLFLPFVVHVIGRPDLQGPLILLYFISAIAGVPLWVWAGKRVGKRRAWAISMALSAAVFVPAAFFHQNMAIWFACVCVGTGICLGGDLLLPPAIQAEIVDADRQTAGHSRAGLLFAVLGFIAKLASALAPFIGFTVLAAVAFNNRAGVTNSDGAIATLAMLYALAPAGLKLLAVLMLRRWKDLT